MCKYVVIYSLAEEKQILYLSQKKLYFCVNDKNINLFLFFTDASADGEVLSSWLQYLHLTRVLFGFYGSGVKASAGRALKQLLGFVFLTGLRGKMDQFIFL